MQRYRSRPRIIGGRADDAPTASLGPQRDERGFTPNLIVFEASHEWEPTGVLGPDGEMQHRFVGLDHIGFLWDRLS